MNKETMWEAMEYLAPDLIEAADQPAVTKHRRLRGKTLLIAAAACLILAVGVVAIGCVSFYSPASMTSALHCSSDETQFVYATAADDFSRAAAQPLNQEAVEVLTSYSTAHMLQQEASLDAADAIVIYPAEDTNYALYASSEGSYVFALDQNKYRYSVKDDGSFYASLSAAIGEEG